MTISWTRDAWSRWNDEYSARVSADLEARSRDGYPGRSWTSALRAPRAERPAFDPIVRILADGREVKRLSKGTWITAPRGTFTRGGRAESASAASPTPRPRLSPAERARRSAALRARHAGRQAAARNAAVDAALRGLIDAPWLKF